MKSSIRRCLLLALCCVVTFNTMGLVFGLGSLFTDIMDAFGVSRAKASLVQSVCLGVSFGIGFITSHFVKYGGHRVAVITGSLMAAAAYIIAFVVTRIEMVIFSIGVIAGIGVSFIHLSALNLLATAEIFHDKESVTLSIFSICTAVGTAVYQPFLRYLIHQYSFRGTFLIQASIFCQMILCGALIGLISPKLTGKTSEIPKPAEEAEAADNVNTAADVDGDKEYPTNPPKSDDGNDDCGNTVDGSPDEESVSLTNNGATVHDAAAGDDDDSLSCCTQDGQGSPKEETMRMMPKTEGNIAQKPRKRTPSESDNFAEGGNLENASLSNRTPVEDSNNSGRLRERWLHHLDILRNIEFVIFAFSCSSSFLFFTQPMMFMTDMVKSNQMSADEGSFFLLILFVGNVIGRMAAGVLHKWLKSKILFVNSISIATGGVTCLFYSFSTSYPHFIAVSFIFGFCYGTMSATLPMVILEILGRDRFVVGMGTMATFACPFMISAGPVGGGIRDLHDSYKIVYYIASAHGSLVGLLLFFTARRINDKKKKRIN